MGMIGVRDRQRGRLSEGRGRTDGVREGRCGASVEMMRKAYGRGNRKRGSADRWQIRKRWRSRGTGRGGRGFPSIFWCKEVDGLAGGGGGMELVRDAESRG